MCQAQSTIIESRTKSIINDAFNLLRDNHVTDARLLFTIYSNYINTLRFPIIQGKVNTFGFTISLLGTRGMFFYLKETATNLNPSVQDALTFYETQCFNSELKKDTAQQCILTPNRVLSEVMPNNKCYNMVFIETHTNQPEELFAYN